jgi:hypothetical protein
MANTFGTFARGSFVLRTRFFGLRTFFRFFEPDPLASLVDTARRLDYGAGRFHGTEDGEA